MPEWVSVTGYWAVQCRVCGKEHRSELMNHRGEYWRARHTTEQAALAAGWRMFVGRGRRWYCPQHGPSKGHNMHEVTR